MKHLYFVRHGQSYINIHDVFATGMGDAENLGLTEVGRQQALAGGKKAVADGISCDLMISSPLLRARETAEIIATELGYPVEKIQVSDLFIEICFGALEGTSWNAFWESGKTYADLYKYAGAETLETLQQRAEKALEFVRSLPEDDILVASHSAFGRALKRVIAGLAPDNEFKDNTALPFGEVLKLI